MFPTINHYQCHLYLLLNTFPDMQKERGKTESGDGKKKIKKEPLAPDRLNTKNIKLLFIGCEGKKTEALTAGLSREGYNCKAIDAQDLEAQADTFMDTVIFVGPESAETQHEQLELVMRINREYEKAYVIAVYDEPQERVYVDTILRKDNDAMDITEFMKLSPQEVEAMLEVRFELREIRERPSEPAVQRSNSSVKVIVCGCDRWMDKVEKMASGLMDEGFTFENVPKLPHAMRRIMTTTEPIVILLGPGEADSAERYRPRAEAITSTNRKSGNKARVIGIYSEGTKGFDFRFSEGEFVDAISVDDFEVMEPNEWVYLLDGTYHDLMAKPAPLERRGSVVCEVVDGNIFDVVDGRIEQVDDTMSEFAKSYILHQRYTGHMTAMDALLNRLKAHFGNQILDIGCGTGDPMRGVIRNVMIAEYTARPRRLRGPTKILSIDSNKPMLGQCEAEFNGMKRGRGEELKLLNMHFLISDLMAVTPGIVQGMGFNKPDTILASYIIYWANDKLGTMRKFHDLLAPGGKLIVVEEAPLVVTPSPHMPASLIEGIKKHIRVIPLDDYYKALQEIGFEPVENGQKAYEIDDQHTMYGRVFIKP